MPKVSSISFDKRRRALDRHKNDPKGNERSTAVFNYVAKCLVNRERDITYSDIANWTGYRVESVRYHFRKLVAVGAINLWDDH